MENLGSLLPAIDLGKALNDAAMLMKSPALAPLVIFTMGIGIFIILVYVVIDAFVYLLERLGFVTRYPVEEENDLF